MLRINQIKINIKQEGSLKDKVCVLLGVSEKEIKFMEIARRSIDARKKPEIFYIYTVDVEVEKEDRVLADFLRKKNRKEQIARIMPQKYKMPEVVLESYQKDRPPVVVAGMGPAGLFCGYVLAQCGLRPVIFERGRRVEERQKDVSKFWETGILDVDSNVQFGEGGAGTFSDGKLNTLVKDRDGRNRMVLETFVKFGAEKRILYDAKPHIGTDVLSDIVKGMREEIKRLGGEIRFESCITDLEIQEGRIRGIIVNGGEKMRCEKLVLAIGHSARDTFSMLDGHKIPMEAKAFAVGFRVQHRQKMINFSQYGMEENEKLEPAPYKLAAKTSKNRGVYTFCMCPGGYVVNASSEPGMTVVNGMSYSKRDGENANSAVIVSVSPGDFPAQGALGGVEFQRQLERRAYEAGQGKIPLQRYGEFKEKVVSKEEGHSPIEGVPDLIEPECKGDFAWSDLSGILPPECNEAFVEGMEAFGRQIEGFDRPDAVLAGVESRTSCPVRILRDEEFQSQIKGIYPCGEGAGYAGGIMSAAMDGVKTAEKIVEDYSREQ